MISNPPEFIEERVSLRELNSWKVGGCAEYFAAPTTFDELKAAYDWALSSGLPVTVISGGTNVLISDQGVSGLVISMRGINGVEHQVEDHFLKISAWAGSSKAEALKVFLKYKLAPALFLTGLPGDMGGGVVMNAGIGEQRTPREFCEIVDWVEVLKPNGAQSELKRFDASAIQWSYRETKGWQPGIVVRVGLKWPMEPVPDIMVHIKEATRNRIMKQPIDKPSCGSTFRNPPGHKSGQLIEQCGLKGFRIGGAEISSKHANFIVTDVQATASDVAQVIEHVKKTVREKFSVELHTEVVYLGNWTT